MRAAKSLRPVPEDEVGFTQGHRCAVDGDRGTSRMMDWFAAKMPEDRMVNVWLPMANSDGRLSGT